MRTGMNFENVLGWNSMEPFPSMWCWRDEQKVSVFNKLSKVNLVSTASCLPSSEVVLKTPLHSPQKSIKPELIGITLRAL